MAIEPDTKDWTWVLRRRCPECGSAAAEWTPATVPAQVRDAVSRWHGVLDGPDVDRRPDGNTWSPLEYAAHVSDVFDVFRERLQLMLDHDEPTFADWDQDAAAIDGDYGSRRPDAVATELADRGERVAAAFQQVPERLWQRRGLRSNGSEFTVLTLAQYFIHDVLHHLHDVRG